MLEKVCIITKLCYNSINMSKVITDSKKIEELLTRGVEEVIKLDDLERQLKSGKQLRVKFGIDPTGSDLHLGHLVVLKKLKQFQELGHRVIFLIGDSTAMIGDPSGRSEARKMLKKEEIKKNEKDYIKQAGKVLDIKKVEVRHNSEWLANKGYIFMAELASKFTVARMIERDDFQKRLKDDIDVSMLEVFYPLFQGYDSVELKADVELGGTDQKFNLLTGRKVQKRYGQPEQNIITVPLLEGLDGMRKMSKSYGNYIAFNDSPQEMFGKIMSLPDALLWKYYKLLTDIPLAEIERMHEQVRTSQVNPKDLKTNLAKEIIKIFYPEKEAQKAEDAFNRQFRDKEMPDDIEESKLEAGSWKLDELLVKLKLVDSKSEARRMIDQGGVKIDGKRVGADLKSAQQIGIKSGMVIQVGKRKFVKIK